MSRIVKGTKYRKWKGRDSPPRNDRPGYIGRIHLQFWDKAQREWRFVCGKRSNMGSGGDTVEDYQPVTCGHCLKHAPDVVERMDVIPSLDDAQSMTVAELGWLEDISEPEPDPFPDIPSLDDFQ